jgi:hypothetical protein
MRRATRLADDFAAALEGGTLAGREPALASLVALAEQLRAIPLATTPDFRTSLRQRLVAVGTVAEPLVIPAPGDRAREWVSGWQVQRRLRTLAGTMAAVTAVAGVGLAASRSLPGDPFYSVKRGAEALQLNLARDNVAKGEKLLQHANTRLHELARLVDAPLVEAAPGMPVQAAALPASLTDRVRSTLRDMDEETLDGTQKLTSAYLATKDEKPLHIVLDFSADQRVGLRGLLNELPADAQPDAQSSLALLDSVHDRAQDLLDVGVCDDSCPTTAPSVPTTSGTPQPTPQAAPTPTRTPDEDELGPVPCSCATSTPAPPGSGAPDEPTVTPTDNTSPDPQPSTSESPSPTPSATPSPSEEPDPVDLPSPVPSPVDSAVDDLVRALNSALPTPLPTLGVPAGPLPATGQ